MLILATLFTQTIHYGMNINEWMMDMSLPLWSLTKEIGNEAYSN